MLQFCVPYSEPKLKPRALLQFVKTSPKLLKNIALKEVQSNQCVIGIRARAHGMQTASLVLQTLVEALKTLNAAQVTGTAGQLCEAAISQALHNQGLIASEALLFLAAMSAFLHHCIGMRLKQLPVTRAAATALLHLIMSECKH